MLICFLSILSYRNWQTKPFMEVEVAIRLLYMLAEALPVCHSAHFTGDTKASALQDMMRTVSVNQNRCNLLQFLYQQN